MKVGGDGVEDRIFFIWPTTIVHKITPDSPLYTLSATDMLKNRFEIVVVLEGTYSHVLQRSFSIIYRHKFAAQNRPNFPLNLPSFETATYNVNKTNDHAIPSFFIVIIFTYSFGYRSDRIDRNDHSSSIFVFTGRNFMGSSFR